jgi:hypothetical protein
LPASGCEMIAKVRRLATSRSISARAEDVAGPGGSSATDSETRLTFQLYQDQGLRGYHFPFFSTNRCARRLVTISAV